MQCIHVNWFKTYLLYTLNLLLVYLCVREYKCIV